MNTETISTGNEVHLVNGRCIFLEKLYQTKTYSGLLEGLPTKSMNREIIGLAKKTAKRLGPGKTYLIKPEETLINIGRKYPFGKPVSIPGIMCIARFSCPLPVSSKWMKGDYSELSIVWFQNQFALPINEKILKTIKSINWNLWADNYED